ncbi:MAG: hypothetical protein HUU23_01130 [Caldilineales bacterium]|nr:hypothetical protein [Caldilineales bacterium]
MIPWQMEEREGEAHIHIEARSVPRWQLQRYLVKLGGQVQIAETHITGQGWQAQIRPGAPYRIGSLTIGVNHLHLSGDAATLRRLMDSLGLWLMRGGG